MPKISQAKKDMRRRQILLAAMSCFARDGLQNATILDICAEAGLSAGAIYGYFTSKEEIIEALSESGSSFASHQMRAASQETTPVEKLRVFFKGADSPHAVETHQYDLRSWAEAIGNRDLRKIYLRRRKEFLGQVESIIVPLAPALKLKPDVLAELIVAVTVGIEQRHAIEPEADIRSVLNALYQLLEVRLPKPRT